MYSGIPCANFTISRLILFSAPKNTALDILKTDDDLKNEQPPQKMDDLKTDNDDLRKGTTSKTDDGLKTRQRPKNRTTLKMDDDLKKQMTHHSRLE